MSGHVGPFWRYYGGKFRDAPTYPHPRHRVIVEPFAGAAGYSCRNPSHDVILVERSPVVAGIWRWLIKATRDDVLSLPDIPDGGTVDDMDAPQAARWLAGFWCNNAVVAPCKRPSKWAGLGADVHNWGGWNHQSRARIAAGVGRIKHWTVIEGDYREAPDVAATWFVDPPYQGRAGRHYPFQPDDFRDLGAWCRERAGQVIVCEQEGADWLPFVPHRTIRSAPGPNRPATSAEVVWLNTPEPSLFGGDDLVAPRGSAMVGGAR